MTHQEKVREFMKMLGRSTGPAMPKLRDPRLRARLIMEEAVETVTALVGSGGALSLAQEFTRKIYDGWDSTNDKPDIVAALDGLADLEYVTLGTYEDIGVDGGKYFDEVHRSNMTKTCEVIDEHGKSGKKGAGYEPPRIADLLEEDLFSARFAVAMEKRGS